MPPPYGGVNVWTANFIQHAPQFDLHILLDAVGPRHIAHAFAPLHRAARLGRGLLLPLWHMSHGAWRAAPVLHVCASGGPSFWRALALATLARRQNRRAVVHLHSRAHTCHPRALAWMRHLARDPGVRCITPCAEDSALYPELRYLPHFLTPSPVRWQGPQAGPGLRAVYAGWMIREKGIFELLDAVSAAPEITLDAYGPNVRPADLQAWQAAVVRRNLQQRVRYCGEVAHQDLASRLSTYETLLSASHGESFGLVTAEAMQLGLPVVARPVGFLQAAPAPTFVPMTAGGVDWQALLRNKASLLPQLSEAARAYVRREFDLQRVMQQWCAVYTA